MDSRIASQLHLYSYIKYQRINIHFCIFYQVWNFQNGHNLHKLEPADDSEVTGVLSLIDNEFILSVGWSRKITKYDDSEGDVSNYHTEVITYFSPE